MKVNWSQPLRIRWNGFNWHTHWWPLLMSMVTNPEIEKKKSAEFLQVLFVRPPASEEQFCPHGVRYREWRVEEKRDRRRDKKPWFQNHQSSVAQSNIFSRAIYFYSSGLMVKGLMNINYGHLNNMIFRTLHEILLEWHDQEQYQTPWQRERMHKHLSGKQRQRRE